jgi:DNA-binding transcriptional regulator YhcF (GntR family)
MEFNNKKSIYLQIADYFYENILRRQMKDNDRIPSVRELAIKIEVNPNTVMRTYQHLQEEQIIYNKRGIGYFVAKQAHDKALKIKKETFIKEELPEFFKTLDLLKMSLEEIKTIQSQL